jgi:SAM-dependent methyltransferase
MSWLSREIAIAHRESVESALANPDLALPYTKFIETMNSLKLPDAPIDLLDIGCGVGGYGVLCQRYFPNIIYCGTDASEHMIEFAKEVCPSGSFRVVPFNENNLNSSIVLASGIVQYAGGYKALSFLLDGLQTYLILHRIPLTPNRSHMEDKETYCGEMESSFRWNLSELRYFLTERAHVVSESIWDRDDMATFVVRSWKSYEC